MHGAWPLAPVEWSEQALRPVVAPFRFSGTASTPVRFGRSTPNWPQVSQKRRRRGMASDFAGDPGPEDALGPVRYCPPPLGGQSDRNGVRDRKSAKLLNCEIGDPVFLIKRAGANQRVMAKIAPLKTESPSQSTRRASLGKLAVRRAFVAALAAALATTAYVLSTVTASTSSANPVPISSVGSPMLRAGYLGAGAFGATVHPADPGDLFVLAVINDTWADQVTAVSGGDVTSWHPAARPFFDGNDGQMLQIWYGQVSSTSPTTLSIAWNGTINNADVALEEFSAGANATWSLVGNGTSSAPFPR